MNTLFPIFVKLEGRTILVVGGGNVGEAKIRALLGTGALVRVVALEATEAVRDWARAGQIVLEQRAVVSADLEGVFLVVVATQVRELNEFIYQDAQNRGVLCNVVDVPDLCDFYYPAVVQRGDLQIAVSTSGQSPFLAQQIRQQLERQFGPFYAAWVAELGATRRAVLSSNLDPDQKRELLQSLASRAALEARLNGSSEKSQGEVA